MAGVRDIGQGFFMANGWPARSMAVNEMASLSSLRRGGIVFPQTQRALLFALLRSGDAIVFERRRRLPAVLSIVVGRIRFPPGVVAAAAASLVTEFPPHFFAQSVVVGVYSHWCFPPGVLPSGDRATLDWIGARHLKRPFQPS